MGGTGASVCIRCAAGKYTDEGGQTTCKNCGAGKYGASAGLTRCESCAAGTSSQALTATSSAACTPCVAGTYGAEAGLAGCTRCPPGKVSTTVGALSSATCIACAKGSYMDLDGGTACKQCEAGRANNDLGQSSCPSCQGSTWSAPGALTCAACNAVIITQGCPDGYQRRNCEPTADASCYQCPPIAFCDYSGSGCETNGVPNCACHAGFEMISKKCVQCGPGRFSLKGENACKSWSTATALNCNTREFYVQGTPALDARCQACPATPANTMTDGLTGCKWQCNGGYQPTF